MNNIKKIAVGLLVGALAIGFSAFTNAPKKAPFSTKYWTNDGTNYQLLTSGLPDVVDDCNGTSSPDACAVESTATGIPNSFPISNPMHYAITPYPGASDAVYNP